MKLLLLTLSFLASLNADMLFNNDRCIVAYGTYSSGTKYKVKYSSNPDTFIRTGLNTSTTPISSDTYVLKYNSNGQEICVKSKAKELGMTEQDYNLVMSIIGGLFGIAVFTQLIRLA